MNTLWRQLHHMAQRCRRREALIDRNQRVEYRDLSAQIYARAEKLRHCGTKTMALAMPNSVEWVLWDLAALKADVCCVPLPPFFTRAQLEHVMRDAGVDSIAGDKRLSVIGEISQTRNPYSKITYTSGSTGTPKGVCLKAHALEALCHSLLEVLGSDFADHHLSVMPLSVLLENVAGIYPALMAGSTIHFADSALLMSNPASLYETLAQTRASTAILVPELLRALLSFTQTLAQPLSALRFAAVGGAMVSRDLIQQANHAGLPVYAGYGLSECGSVVSLNTPTHHRAGSVGRVLPHLAARIDEGQIMIDNPLASGYLREPDFEGLATGDCGEIDSDGYLYVSGRLDNLLITSWGRNINPEWLEAKLLDHPGIDQAIVVGADERSLGALVVANPLASADAITEAIRATNLELPAYAQVHRWRKVDPFTRANGLLTGNGRPVRAHIHKLYSPMEIHYEHHVL